MNFYITYKVRYHSKNDAKIFIHISGFLLFRNMMI